VSLEEQSSPLSRREKPRLNLEDGVMFAGLFAFFGAALAMKQSVLGDHPIVFLVLGCACLVVLLSTQLFVRFRFGDRPRPKVDPQPDLQEKP